MFCTPSNFNNWNNANEFNVNSTGTLSNDNVNNGYGVRPISNVWFCLGINLIWGVCLVRRRTSTIGITRLSLGLLLQVSSITTMWTIATASAQFPIFIYLGINLFELCLVRRRTSMTGVTLTSSTWRLLVSLTDGTMLVIATASAQFPTTVSNFLLTNRML